MKPIFTNPLVVGGPWSWRARRWSASQCLEVEERSWLLAVARRRQASLITTRGDEVVRQDHSLSSLPGLACYRRQMSVEERRSRGRSGNPRPAVSSLESGPIWSTEGVRWALRRGARSQGLNRPLSGWLLKTKAEWSCSGEGLRGALDPT